MADIWDFTSEQSHRLGIWVGLTEFFTRCHLQSKSQAFCRHIDKLYLKNNKNKVSILRSGFYGIKELRQKTLKKKAVTHLFYEPRPHAFILSVPPPLLCYSKLPRLRPSRGLPLYSPSWVKPDSKHGKIGSMWFRKDIEEASQRFKL